MSIYTLNQSLLAQALLPPQKRLPIYIALMTEWLSGLQSRNDILNYYIDGFSVPDYNPGTTYPMGGLVNGGLNNKQAVYESQTADNIGNSLQNPDYWVQASPYFIGNIERASYSCAQIVLEYALNRYFHTTFRQPTAIGTGAYTPKSDIYITINNNGFGTFYIGQVEDQSSYISQVSSTGFVERTSSSASFDTYTFIVNVPLSLYTTLPGYDGTAGSADNVLRNFVDKYNIGVAAYIIVTYT